MFMESLETRRLLAAATASIEAFDQYAHESYDAAHFKIHVATPHDAGAMVRYVVRHIDTSDNDGLSPLPNEVREVYFPPGVVWTHDVLVTGFDSTSYVEVEPTERFEVVLLPSTYEGAEYDIVGPAAATGYLKDDDVELIAEPSTNIWVGDATLWTVQAIDGDGLAVQGVYVYLDSIGGVNGPMEYYAITDEFGIATFTVAAYEEGASHHWFVAKYENGPRRSLAELWSFVGVE